MDRHPIQLINVIVEELYIKAFDRSSFEDKDYPRDFSVSVLRSDYDSEKKLISVRVDLDLKPESDNEVDRPFEMRVSVVGHFEVDEDSFDIEHLEKFADANAPLILFPFIREHAYALSVRSGFDPVLFPLIQVPVFKTSKKD